MNDDHLIDEASAVADRRPASTTSRSEGIRLLDRIARLFSPPDSDGPRGANENVLFSWGPLEVRRLIGAGAFGEVYEAWDPTLQREVALKLRSPETGALRWLDEARNLARVRHSNVVTVHGADVLEGRAGIWTERLVGRTLEEELAASGPFPEKEVVRIGRDVASALAAVHAAGLIHGDVKTSNIMLEEGDAPRRAVLVDFGSADHLPGEDELPAYAMGTPLTMAPEVLDGKPAAPGSDVYGLGATLFRLITGRYPVEAASIEELRRAHRSFERVRVRDVASGTSARLARAVERALEPDPAHRWHNAQALERALSDVADPTRRIRTRAAAVGAAVAVLAAAGFIAFLALRPGPGPVSRGRLAKPRDPGAFVEAWRRSGPSAANDFGWVTAAVDLDHDGCDDIVAIEANWKGSDGAARGRVVVFRGGSKGPSPEPTMITEGDEPDAAIGFQAANAGDTDGDGFDEVLVSQEAREKGQMLPRVGLFVRDPSTDRLSRTWTYTGKLQRSQVGRGMSSAGDVNGDGYGDVLISEGNEPDLQTGEGRVLLFLGSRDGLSREAAWSVRSGQSHAWMGSWMRPLGDVNGDGFDDAVVGAASWDSESKVDCGQARVYLGSANGLALTPLLTLEGANTNSALGCTVGGAGDVNGDGFADLLIGEPKYSDERHPERGRALVFLGSPRGPSPVPDWQVLGPLSYAQYGHSLTPLDDIDGDGYDDFAVSALQYSDSRRSHLGMVEIFRGGPQGPDSRPLWRAVGDAEDGHLGFVVNSGDLNGDHVSDLVVGAPLFSDAVAKNRGLIVAYLADPNRSPR